MFIWLKLILSWFARNPLLLAAVLLLASNGFYILKAGHHKRQAANAIIRAESAEEALRRTKLRDEKLKKLEHKHRGENETIYRLIASRSYFDGMQ